MCRYRGNKKAKLETAEAKVAELTEKLGVTEKSLKRVVAAVKELIEK